MLPLLLLTASLLASNLFIDATCHSVGRVKSGTPPFRFTRLVDLLRIRSLRMRLAISQLGLEDKEVRGWNRDYLEALRGDTAK